ncbi:MAG: hypothetical protein GY799_23470 [Desulfobulbaceae bacterium]|nr:hypothetical protein [Desulfobulbaceae bacterium]
MNKTNSDNLVENSQSGGSSNVAAWLVITVFLSIIFAVPVFQHVHHLCDEHASEEQFPELIITAEGLKVFEKSLERRMVLRRFLVPPVQNIITRYAGCGNEKVYTGRNGFLFLSDSLDYLTGRGFLTRETIARRELEHPGISADPRLAIVQLAKDLSVHGIKLIVMPVPVKMSLCPAEFSSRFDPHGTTLHNPSFDVFRQQISPALIFTPALLNASDAPFLKTDTHWTPQGLDISARELARFIESSGFNIAPRQEGTYVRSESTVTNAGDLVGMLGLSADQDIYKPESVQIYPVLNKDRSKWKACPDAEILLLGDSFSNIYSGKDLKWGTGSGLAEQLSYYLQRPIDVIIQNGDGAFATRHLLAKHLRASKTDKGIRSPLENKKIVIFQFAETQLATGNWRAISMPGGMPHGSGPVQQVDASSSIYSGVIRDVTPVPRPGTVPYDDALAAVHLTQISPELPDGSNQCVFYTWGLRERKLAEAAEYKRGQKIKVKLVRWNKSPQGIRRVLKLRLRDPGFDLIDLSLYWVRSEDCSVGK